MCSYININLFVSVCLWVEEEVEEKVFTNIVIFFLQALQPPISQQVWSTSLEFVFDKKKKNSVLGVGKILQCNTEVKCSVAF